MVDFKDLYSHYDSWKESVKEISDIFSSLLKRNTLSKEDIGKVGNFIHDLDTKCYDIRNIILRHFVQENLFIPIEDIDKYMSKDKVLSLFVVLSDGSIIECGYGDYITWDKANGFITHSEWGEFAEFPHNNVVGFFSVVTENSDGKPLPETEPRYLIHSKYYGSL